MAEKNYNFDLIVSQFLNEGDKMVSVGPFGEGHINDTYAAVIENNGEKRRIIVQRINHSIFTEPAALMDNIYGVTTFLKKIIEANGGDVLRETLTVIPAKDGKLYFVDEGGNYWRSYIFIEGATTYQSIQTKEDFYNCGAAFGNFQRLLADYPADQLSESIPNFHNTEKRFEAFVEAVNKDICGRAKDVQAEIEFAMARKEAACEIVNMLKEGKIPLRVTHNDTKLNNIMIDDATGKAICIIDLDTIMPGAAAYDFGDSIRFGASTGAEDEVDLSKIEMSLELFEVFASGYLSVAKEFLTDEELYSLSIGAKIMTFECGIRFLTDYLSGDTYFKIHRPNHNLDRCRTQFKLVADMEKKMDQMHVIVNKYAK